MIEREFQFNTNGVCVNPNEAFRAAIKGGEVKVWTAKIGAKWIQGFIISTYTTGMCTPISLRSKCFNSENEAVFYAVTEAERWANSEIRRMPRTEFCDKQGRNISTAPKANLLRYLLSKMAEFKKNNDPRQLKLF